MFVTTCQLQLLHRRRPSQPVRQGGRAESTSWPSLGESYQVGLSSIGVFHGMAGVAPAPLGLWKFHQPVKELKSAGKIVPMILCEKFEPVKKMCLPCDFASDTPMLSSHSSRHQVGLTQKEGGSSYFSSLLSLLFPRIFVLFYPSNSSFLPLLGLVTIVNTTCSLL